MVRTLSVKSVQSVVMPIGLMAVEITLQELNSRSDARAYLEVLLNGPPRRARGKLSKRTARIRGGASTSPGAPGNNDSRHTGRVLNLLTSHYNRAFVATNLFIHKEAERNYQPQGNERTQRIVQVNRILFVSLCRCGEKRFLFTRRKPRVPQ